MSRKLNRELIVAGLRPFHFRGKQRLLGRLTPECGSRRIRIFGSEFELDLADYIQRCLFIGTYEHYEIKLLTTHLRNGMTFVDAGANVGYYTAAAASLVGDSGKVIAFEPSPYAYRRLTDLVSKNNLKNVVPVNAGLGDTEGKARIYLGKGSKNHSPTMVPHDGADSVEVRVMRLDSMVQQLGLQQIDFLKIDVEGYEPHVLGGASGLLAERRIGAVLCEFNEGWLTRSGSDCASLNRLLTSAGFREQTSPELRKHSDNRLFVLERS